jgi:hypothetical protein
MNMFALCPHGVGTYSDKDEEEKKSLYPYTAHQPLSLHISRGLSSKQKGKSDQPRKLLQKMKPIPMLEHVCLNVRKATRTTAHFISDPYRTLEKHRNTVE